MFERWHENRKPETTTLSVWSANGVPARMVWNGVRYRVTDTPTRLEEEVYHPALTHPARRTRGWRFQATTAGGVSRMFELDDTDGIWTLLRVYD